MKKLKYVVVFFLTLLMVVMSSEFYQLYLGNFTNQFYYFTVSEQDEREELFSVIEQAATSNGADVFAISSVTKTAKHSNLTIYATSSMLEVLSEKYNIQEGTQKSIFSGNTEIIFEDFVKGAELSSVERFYFTGDMEQVKTIKAIVNRDYASGYIHKEASSNTEWLIYACWGLVFAVGLVLSWFDLQFSKKEIFVRLSMGASRMHLMLKQVILDTAIFSVIFFGIRTIYEQFYMVSYSPLYLSIIFGGFVILNAALYCSLLKINYKEVIYSANINKSMLPNCYVLKAISLIIAIASLTVNIELIVENSAYLRMYDEINQYEEYSFMQLEIDASSAETITEEFELAGNIRAEVFCDLYRQNKVALSSYSASDDDEDSPFIYTNQNTIGIDELEVWIGTDANADFYILYPSDADEMDREFVETTVKGGFGAFSSEAIIEWVEYSSKADIVFFDSYTVDYPFGFEKQNDPIIIYCNFPLENLYCEGYFVGVETMHADIMYRLNESDIEYLYETYGEITNISLIGVIERCDEFKASFMRIVLLNTVISVFMLLLECLVVITLIRMEYAVNLKELIIKKILGYSVWKRNQAVFLLNLFTALIGCMTIVICSLMFNISQWYYAVFSSLIFVGVETVLILYFINRIERTSIQRILKGGGL